MNQNIKQIIIPGYNGIMDLDLTHIPSKYHKHMVALHNVDIWEYKHEQSMRPPELRYENAIVKALRVIHVDTMALKNNHSIFT